MARSDKQDPSSEANRDDTQDGPETPAATELTPGDAPAATDADQPPPTDTRDATRKRDDDLAAIESAEAEERTEARSADEEPETDLASALRDRDAEPGTTGKTDADTAADAAPERPEFDPSLTAAARDAEVPAGDTDEHAGTSAAEAPRSAPVAAAAPAPARRRGGFLPLLLGGVIAAALGFIAARGEWLDPYLPPEYRAPRVDLAPIETQLVERTAETEALAARLDDLSATIEAQSSQEGAAALEEIETTLADLSERLAALEGLEERVAALEARPLAEAAPDDLASSADIAGLQSALEAQRAEIAALAERTQAAEAEAQTEAQRVLAQAALTRLETAFDSGEPFGPALDALAEVAPVEVPEALAAPADEGVATLAQLQEAFPEAARDALEAVRADSPQARDDGLAGFLRRQLSVRSVVPREGDDPDAVLSRAEAAVRQGALGEALAELEALPETGRAAMQGWLDSAEARHAAQQAAEGLADSLTSN